MKEEWMKTELMNRLSRVFNADGTKDRVVTRFVPLELEINRYTKRNNIAVTDLNSTDMFLEYKCLVKHNLEVNWNTEII